METNMNESFFDTAGKAYEDAYASDAGLLTFLDKALQSLPPNASVLDVGCGTGKPVASTISAHGHQVLGIDRSQVMIELAGRQVPGAKFARADMLTYSPEEQKFDAIFAVFVFFALSREQAQEMLSKFCSWLKPGGRLFVGTIPADGYDVGSAKFDDEGYYIGNVDNQLMGQTTQISLLSKKGWAAFLGAAAFEVEGADEAPFTPPESSNGGEVEQHYFVTARRSGSWVWDDTLST